MDHPRFFGFGSLVNCNTHTYPNPRGATLAGWRRIWMPAGRNVAALSVVPHAETTIQGLTADVPNADWDALDAREAGYTRHVIELPEETAQTWVYCVPGARPPVGDTVILQSYLDVVLQGFLTQYGEQGVRDFFATTDGWDVPLLDDRIAPKYPRHHPIAPDLLEFFDSVRASMT